MHFPSTFTWARFPWVWATAFGLLLTCLTFALDGSMPYRYPDGLFSCNVASSWQAEEHGPSKDGLAPGVTFFAPGSPSLVDLSYFPKSGTYAGRRLVPPVYKSPRDYYQQQIRQKVLLLESDELPVVYSRLIPSRLQDKRAFEFSVAYTESFLSPELPKRVERLRDDMVLIPLREGLFVAKYSADKGEFSNGLDTFRTVLKSLTIRKAEMPAIPGASKVPEFPAPTLMGLPVTRTTAGDPQAHTRRIIRQWHGEFSWMISPKSMVIASEAEWTRIWPAFRTGRPVPMIDFSEERPVVVFAGRKPTGGYYVNFGVPTQQGKALIVPFCVEAPRGIVTEALSQPWGVAVVGAAGRNVTVEEVCKPTAEARQTLGAIAGRVTDQGNSPVPLVRATAEGGPHNGKLSTETRRNGDYRLNGLDPGLYHVTFINAGFQVVVFRKVKVLPGKTVTLNVRLRVDPCPSGGCS